VRLQEIYGDDYYTPWLVAPQASLDLMKQHTFSSILDQCELSQGESLLDVGCADGVLLELGAIRGAKVFGVDLNQRAIERAGKRVPSGSFHCGHVTDRPFTGTVFDAVTMVDFIEHVRQPLEVLCAVRRMMCSGSRLVISTPRVDSALRRLARRRWPQYREEHLTYFSLEGMRRILTRSGFVFRGVRPTRKALTLDYVYGQAVAYPVPAVTAAVKVTHRLLPFARGWRFRVGLGEMTVVAMPNGAEWS
jgi:2-polyprenyl-3-methyl-5-hydroxy-6-metoxy-1,4-benzoquinol methylase